MKKKVLFCIILLGIPVLAFIWFLPYFGAWLDGDMSRLEIETDGITEILVTERGTPEAVSITDSEEIRDILSKARFWCAHLDFLFDDEVHWVRTYRGHMLESIFFPDESNIYNRAFETVLSQLVQRLKNGETNIYQYVISIPPKVYYRDAVEYLLDNGYEFRHRDSNDYSYFYPHLSIKYSVSGEDLRKFTSKELRGKYALGVFEPDNLLANFIDRLKENGCFVSCDLVDLRSSRGNDDNIIELERGTYIYLSKYLSEEETEELEMLAKEAGIEFIYHEPSRYDYKIVLISPEALSDETLKKINDDLQAIAR